MQGQQVKLFALSVQNQANSFFFEEQKYPLSVPVMVAAALIRRVALCGSICIASIINRPEAATYIKVSSDNHAPLFRMSWCSELCGHGSDIEIDSTVQARV